MNNKNNILEKTYENYIIKTEMRDIMESLNLNVRVDANDKKNLNNFAVV